MSPRAALALIAMMAVASASQMTVEGAPMRHLAQTSFTCPDVKALEGNCPALCDCVKKAAPNDPNAANCQPLCEACVKDAKSCEANPGAPLPASCAKYAAQASTCIGGASGRR